jgi:capsular polysaccharide biosynthesis protein
VSDADLGLGHNVHAKRAMNGHGHLREGFWAANSRELEDYVSQDERFGKETYPGLVSLSFIRSTIKRTAKAWCTLAVIGLLAGVGFCVARPAGYQATAKLLMAQPPGAEQGWIINDQAAAETLTVAAMAIKSLHLPETPANFLNSYTVVATTDRILVLTVKASTPQGALNEARAVARAFLDFRKSILNKDEETNSDLQRQIAKAQRRLTTIDARIAKVQQQVPSTSQLHQLHSLKAARNQANSLLTQLKQLITTTEANTEIATTIANHGSVLFDGPALVPQSVKRRVALYAVGGLIGGLVLGLGLVVLTAVVSTRLRRRDDVARALAVPVRLSIRKGRLGRRRLRRQGLAAAQDKDFARVSMHMASAVAPTSGGFASLAVVAVDDVEVAAVCLASLALSGAQEGLQVVFADLCDGAPGARLLGVSDPGVGNVTVGAASLVVVVPERDDVLPAGPLRTSESGRQSNDPLTAACASADLVLTLATLDPALGGDHLAEWASSVVVVVTTGRASAERIHSVGEMVRLARLTQITAVLVGADKLDESLGMPGTQVVTSSSSDSEVIPVDEDGAPFAVDRAGRRGPHGDP